MLKSIILIVLFLTGPLQFYGAEKKTGLIKLSLTSGRSSVTNGIGNGLAVRVVKDPSFFNRHFGWIVEVVELPHRLESKNLLFQNPTRTTADISQVYAWQVGNPDFPNERRIKVKGYPVSVTIRLDNAVVVGTGVNSKFVKGKLKVVWEWESTLAARTEQPGRTAFGIVSPGCQGMTNQLFFKGE